jgi:hypothetical protein
MVLELLLDNWTLQDLAELLRDGLTAETYPEIRLDEKRTRHSLKRLMEAPSKLDMLLSLLSNIVFFDRLVVDERFTYAWSDSLPLANLTAGIIHPEPFEALGGDLARLRSSIVAELCVTPTLREAQAANEAAFARPGAPHGTYMSQVIWGGAGMLARSSLTETPYLPHPCRRCLIEQAGIFSPRRTSADIVKGFVSLTRARMFRYRDANFDGACAALMLPPVPVEAINEAATIKELLPAALSLRDKYAPLRDWLRLYQEALDQEDERTQLKFEKELRSTAKGIEHRYADCDSGTSRLSISLRWFELSVPPGLYHAVRNRFGVRASLSNLILAPRGERALQKLLRMFGEGRSLLGGAVLRELNARYCSQNGAPGKP